MTPEDAAHERRIEDALQTWHEAKGPWKIRAAFQRFRELVAQRSAAAVRELEERKGIAS